MTEQQEERTYWVQVFTPTTWSRFVDTGGTVTGFRQHRWNHIQSIKPGDRILCYLTGVSKWVGILDVICEPYLDTTRIWEEELFPCRVEVEVVASLSLEQGVPIRELKELSIFRIKNWGLYLVASPSKWTAGDGEIVTKAIEAAEHQIKSVK
jgi:EVE domain-containing protein